MSDKQNLPVFVKVFFLEKISQRGHGSRKLDVALWFRRLLFHQRLFVNVTSSIALSKKNNRYKNSVNG